MTSVSDHFDTGKHTPNDVVGNGDLFADLRAGRWIAAIGFLSFLPMVMLGFPCGLPFGLTGIPSALAFAYGLSLVYDFLCPHCGKTFVWNGWGRRNEFARRCLHCGFPKRGE